MSEKQPNRPDRAGDGLDDLDVPTYRQATEPPRSVYDRAGRAAPQSIPAPAEEETRVIPRQLDDHSRPLRSDAPTTSLPLPDSEPAPAAAPASDLEPVPLLTEEPMGAGTVTAIAETPRPDHRRGTMDLGLLLLRIVGGLWLILHALAVFFQLGNNPGLAGLEQAYESYYMGTLLAVAVPAADLAAGVFLVLGLITPLFAAVATVATGFHAIHELDISGVGLNLFQWSDAVWLALVLFGMSIALQFTGPGFYSLDYSRGWARRPLASSWIFIVIGIIALGAVWWFGAGVNPLN